MKNLLLFLLIGIFVHGVVYCRIDVKSNQTNKDESKTIKVSKYKKNWPKLKPDLRGTISATPYKPNTWAYITLTIHNDLMGEVKDPTGTHIIEVYYLGTKIHPISPKLKVRKWTFPGPVIPPKSSTKIKQKTDVFTKKYGIYEIVFKLDTANKVIEANEKNNEGKITYETK